MRQVVSAAGEKKERMIERKTLRERKRKRLSKLAEARNTLRSNGAESRKTCVHTVALNSRIQDNRMQRNEKYNIVNGVRIFIITH